MLPYERLFCSEVCAMAKALRQLSRDLVYHTWKWSTRSPARLSDVRGDEYPITTVICMLIHAI